jgi:uncharacterized phiE125 gp8 family phage protein
MGYTLLIPPAVEPLSLAEAKSYLRVEHDDEDELIGGLIRAARDYVEMATSRVLITQTWRFVYNAWPLAGWLRLPLAPVRQLVAARIYDAANISHAVDTAAFTLDVTAATFGFVPWPLPAPARKIAGVELDVELGYGPAGADVPAPLRQTIRLLVAESYEKRNLNAETAIPFATLAALFAPYRMLSL